MLTDLIAFYEGNKPKVEQSQQSFKDVYDDQTFQSTDAQIHSSFEIIQKSFWPHLSDTYRLLMNLSRVEIKDTCFLIDGYYEIPFSSAVDIATAHEEDVKMLVLTFPCGLTVSLIPPQHSSNIDHASIECTYLPKLCITTYKNALDSVTVLGTGQDYYRCITSHQLIIMDHSFAQLLRNLLTHPELPSTVALFREQVDEHELDVGGSIPIHSAAYDIKHQVRNQLKLNHSQAQAVLADVSSIGKSMRVWLSLLTGVQQHMLYGLFDMLAFISRRTERETRCSFTIKRYLDMGDKWTMKMDARSLATVFAPNLFEFIDLNIDQAIDLLESAIKDFDFDWLSN